MLLKGSAIALETGGESLNAKISRQGEIDFKKFMDETIKLQNESQRNERFEQFIRSCATHAGIALE